MDLFIAFHSDAGWGAPIYLGDTINGPTSDAEARLSPDNKTLYFSSERVVTPSIPLSPTDGNRVLKEIGDWNNGLYNIWFVNLAAVIREIQEDI
jgi:WD40-like Beta Propeller Repeat